MELWFLFAVLGYTIGAVSNCMDKHLMNQQYHPVTTSMLRVFFNTLLLAAAGLLLSQLTLTVSTLLLALIPGLLLGFSFVVYLRFLQLKNASEILPFWESLDVLVIFLGSTLLLQEHTVPLNYIGILVILIGIYLVLTESIHHAPRLNRSFFLVAFILPIDLAYALLIKHFLGTVNPFTLAVATYTIAFLTLAAAVLVMRLRHKTTLFVRPHLRPVLLTSLFAATGVAFLYLALSQGNASKVYPLAGINIIAVFLLATLFLKEKFYKHRLIGTMIMFVGIYLVSL